MPENSRNHNVPEYSVSEISFAVKQTVEDHFAHVRIRGEISGCKLAPSGHMYLTLKDEKSGLSAVCWKGTVGTLPFQPEDGLEVVCTGRMTTFPGQSKYQLVIAYMEPAGAGALMALLEKRKAQFAKEGLFDEAHKKSLPYLPGVIGIVTSPTGAVIRDMLHRLEERFPRHVLLWPVLVQGEKASEQVTNAINGFNRMREGESIPRPDLLIVARGGGSIEDLWAFNEENVVRAVYTSAIPVISAVGHETDVTLCDYVADKRAPTPTAAAEFAVPVRTELLAYTARQEGRLNQSLAHVLHERSQRVYHAARLLPGVIRLFEHTEQRFDGMAERLAHSLPRFIEKTESRLHTLTAQLRSPADLLTLAEQRLQNAAKHLANDMQETLTHAAHRLNLVHSQLKPSALLKDITHKEKELKRSTTQLSKLALQRIERQEQQLEQLTRLMDSYHYKKVLARGFALVREDSTVITSKSQVKTGATLSLEFKDGKQTVTAGTGARSKPTKKKPASTTQESLF